MISAIVLIKKPVITKVQRPKLKSTNLQITGKNKSRRKKEITSRKKALLRNIRVINHRITMVMAR